MHLNLIYCRLLNTDLMNRKLNGVSLTLPYNHRKKYVFGILGPSHFQFFIDKTHCKGVSRCSRGTLFIYRRESNKLSSDQIQTKRSYTLISIFLPVSPHVINSLLLCICFVDFLFAVLIFGCLFVLDSCYTLRNKVWEVYRNHC